MSFVQKALLGLLALFVFGQIVKNPAQAGLHLAFGAAGLAAISIVKPLPLPMLRSRISSFAALLMLSLVTISFRGGAIRAEQETRLAVLKEASPAEYLSVLQAHDRSRWVRELEAMDPERHKIEVARLEAEAQARAAEQAQRQAEAQRRAAAQAAERQARETARAAERRALACGKDSEVIAYVMSQDFVKAQLRAPSTAKFPSISASGVQAQAIGDCKFQISGYVDAQNGFGAMLRSRYTATLLLADSEKREWRALDVKLQN